MFIGHFAVGMGAKAAAPRVSLGSLFLAAQFVDLLWPTLLLFGVERVKIVPGITTVTPLDFEHYPITHSLLMAAVWGLLFTLVYWLFQKNKRGAIVLGLCVVSHWFLDLLVHRPDLPLIPGGATRLGIGLWNSLPATLIAEGLLFVIGIWLYLRTTTAKNKVGRFAFWGLVVSLAAIYIANLFGPPPPDVQSIAWAGHLQWLFVIWAYWVDRNRVAVSIAVSS
ncbi:MAG: metal-dependent hydrolase [Phaeodactylibacter sp.]|nr:metal-dependent hydrolase [Phaeodactylibacter sp.]MCB9300713.1 metal-dependent hydrolase [Lewinellaceae bacterium]HQU59666.1 metal-dependent hydrolase [Saprospiraceae bacterium]